ncbi:MAG TPA: MFS transporter, partial [Candidatus Limnocylindrales bacterium]|nr:MFS transporter [Candidatus Limnocylindrales bacterium]
MAGNSVALVAIPWFVLETTGSAALTGVTAAVTVLPTILSGALSGVLVDRVGHRRASVIADLASALAVAAIPLLHVTLGIAFWQLLVLVFLGAVLDVPGVSARVSLMPDIAQGARVRLERANALMSAFQRGSQLAGPLIAGGLIATVGATGALWLNAGTFLVSAVLIGALVPRPERVADVERVTYLARLRQGLRFLREDRLVRFILLVIAVTNLIASPVFSVGLPVYANRVLGSPIALGALLAALGGGALAGTLGYAAVGRRLPRRATLLGALFFAGAPLGLLAITESVAVDVVVLFLVGIAGGPLNPLIITLVQERTPSHMRGQVIGGTIAVAWIAMPIG